MRLIIAVCLFFFSLAVQSAPPFIPPVGVPQVFDCDLASMIDVPQYSFCIKDSDGNGLPDESPIECGTAVPVYVKEYGQGVFVPQCLSVGNLPLQVLAEAQIHFFMYVMLGLSLMMGAIFGSRLF